MKPPFIHRLTFLCLGIALIGSSCATTKIDRAYKQALEKRSSPLFSPEKEIPQGPPYQLIVQLNTKFLEDVVADILKKELLEDIDLNLPAYSQPSRPPLPRGPGFLLQRLRGMGRSLLESMSPGVRLEDVTLAFNADCPSCLQLGLHLWTGFQNEDGSQGPGLQAKIMLAGTLEDDARPSPGVLIQFDRLESIHLRTSADVPPPIRGLFPAFEEGLTVLAENLLSEHRDRLRFRIPISERMTISDDVHVKHLGFAATTGASQTLRLGLNTNLATSPELDLQKPIAANRYDWALMSSDAFVYDLARLSIKAGKIPMRFDRRGRPDPKGKAEVFLDAIRFERAFFQMDLRIFYRGFPAWWRKFQAKGHFEVKSGQLVMLIDAFEPGEGEGALWTTAFVKRKVMAQRSAHALGRIIPDEIPLPGDNEQHLKPILSDVRLESGRLILLGKVKH